MTGFLFDENLPTRVTFTPSLPLIHSSYLGTSLSDSMLWNHARTKALVIVTKDADFSDRIMSSNPPPWIVHIRFGNMRRREFHSLLAKVWPQVEALLPTYKLICVYRDHIEYFRD